MALFISALILAGYFFLIYKFTGALRQELLKLRVLSRILYFSAMLLPGVFLIWVLQEERFIYYWDLSGYWIRAIDFTQLFFEKPFVAFEEIYNTIRRAEYNLLANLFIAPFNKLLGLSFGMYVFSVYLVYFLPAALLASNLIILTLKNSGTVFQNLSLPFLCLLFTPLVIPIRFGFIDSVGLVFIFMILICVVKANFLRSFHYKTAIAIGIMMLVLVFSRRWYAFWATAFYAGLFLTNSLYAVYKKDWKSLKHTFLNLLLAGSVPLGIMLLFFYPFFEMTVLKDYGDIYSAYRRSMPAGQLQNVVNFFGFGLLVLFVGATFIQARQAKSLTLFFLIGSAIIIILFTRINDFGGYQHYYLLLPAVLLFTLRGILLLSKKGVALIVFFFGFLLVNNAMVFTNIFKFGDDARIFASVEGASKVRADYQQIMEVSNDIISYGENGSMVYVLASSRLLNDNTIKNSKLPELRNEFKYLHITQHVDKRDHFPNELFTSNYVVVTDPAQYHLGKENQVLIGYFNDAILSGALKKHYKMIRTYPLNDGVKAYLMQKISGFSKTEIKGIRDYFKTKFPEYPRMFDVQENALKTAQIIKGDAFGNVSFLDNETIKMFPGKTDNSSVAFTIAPQDKSVSFVASFYNKDEISENCNPNKDGEVALIVKGDGKEINKLTVNFKKDTPVLIDVTTLSSLEIIVNKGKNEDRCDFFLLRNFKFN